MRIIPKERFVEEREEIKDLIKQGNIFIYPTDTIYGIGCDASNSKSVLNLRNIKNRETKPFSIIAPNIKWIIENCEISIEGMKWIEKLPGPYTLIFKLKDNKNSKEKVCKEVNDGKNTIGVRIPKHWISDLVKELGFPIVTTSVNLSGDSNMTNLEDLNTEIAKKVGFILYEGDKKGKPSTLVDLSGEKIRITER